MRFVFRSDFRRRAANIGRRVTVAALLSSAACTNTVNEEAAEVVIPNGATFAAAADSLASAGVIGSTRMFRLYASLTGRDRELKAGRYELQPGLSWAETVEELTKGQGFSVSLTIPEGYAIDEIVPLIARALEVPEDSVRTAVRDSVILRRLDVPTPTLEGYLFPETYSLVLGASARDAVQTMVAEFERRWKSQWNVRLQELAMTRHDIVTLASIIEKEARIAAERPVISAVYHNRLRIGMPLQADPTVQYALDEHVTRVLYRHLEIDSPYNTYRNRGLPPGPIASPGAASVEAALHPASVPYLYFVAHPDGHHEFRRTFAEHTEARAALRREQANRDRGTKTGSGAASPGTSAP